MVREKKFRYIIDQETELRLLEEEHTEALFALTDENREYLHQWLSLGHQHRIAFRYRQVYPLYLQAI